MAELKETRAKRYHREEIEPIETISSPQPKKVKKIKKKKETEEKVPKEHPFLNKIILTIIILFLSFVSYGTLIEPKLINIKEYKVESNLLPDSFHGLKIVQLSDIHYGTTINDNQLSKIITKINSLKPDIIIFSGDLLDKNITITEETKKKLITQLTALECSLYKYAIYGDEDLKNKEYTTIMDKSNFILLNNENKSLYYKDQTPIMITGLSPLSTKPNYTIITDFIEEQDTTNYFKLVITHEPDSIDKFINYNPSLVLSGHTLGGTIDFKISKPLLLPENGKKYYEDYQKINNTEIYISNGLGTNSLNTRILNPPSISLYRLYKTN